MIKFPNKFQPVANSVIGHMLIIVQQIPRNGIMVDLLIKRTQGMMDLVDFIDAMTCLYSIDFIRIEDRMIFKKEQNV